MNWKVVIVSALGLILITQPLNVVNYIFTNFSYQLTTSFVQMLGVILLGVGMYVYYNE